MAVVKRANVAEPTLPRETVEVEALGGEVVVRGLLLTERLDLEARIVHHAKAAKAAREAAGGTDAGAAPAAGVHEVMPMLLHMAVLDADGLQLWSAEQWQQFGGKHAGQALALFNVAWRLAGFSQADNAKN